MSQFHVNSNLVYRLVVDNTQAKQSSAEVKREFQQVKAEAAKADGAGGAGFAESTKKLADYKSLLARIAIPAAVAQGIASLAVAWNEARIAVIKYQEEQQKSFLASVKAVAESGVTKQVSDDQKARLDVLKAGATAQQAIAEESMKKIADIESDGLIGRVKRLVSSENVAWSDLGEFAADAYLLGINKRLSADGLSEIQKKDIEQLRATAAASSTALNELTQDQAKRSSANQTKITVERIHKGETAEQEALRKKEEAEIAALERAEAAARAKQEREEAQKQKDHEADLKRIKDKADAEITAAQRASDAWRRFRDEQIGQQRSTQIGAIPIGINTNPAGGR